MSIVRNLLGFHVTGEGGKRTGQLIIYIYIPSIMQYAIEKENNTVNTSIKNLSQESHLCPFVPVEKLL